MSAGHESGLDLRRDDGTLDVSLNWIARNGEVHFTIEVNSQYGLAKTIVDFTAEQTHEISGAFKEAARHADLTEAHAAGLTAATAFPRPAGVPPGKNPQGRYHPDGPGWTARDVGHVLGERD